MSKKGYKETDRFSSEENAISLQHCSTFIS